MCWSTTTGAVIKKFNARNETKGVQNDSKVKSDMWQQIVEARNIEYERIKKDMWQAEDEIFSNEK